MRNRKPADMLFVVVVSERGNKKKIMSEKRGRRKKEIINVWWYPGRLLSGGRDRLIDPSSCAPVPTQKHNSIIRKLVDRVRKFSSFPNATAGAARTGNVRRTNSR